MTRRVKFLIAGSLSAVACLGSMYALAWKARNYQDFGQYWASFPTSVLIFALFCTATGLIMYALIECEK